MFGGLSWVHVILRYRDIAILQIRFISANFDVAQIIKENERRCCKG